MASTANMSAAIKDAMIPALLSIDMGIREASLAQQELKGNLERLGAELQVLQGLMGDGESKDLEQAILRNIIVRKRLINLNRRLGLISNNLAMKTLKLN